MESKNQLSNLKQKYFSTYTAIVLKDHILDENLKKSIFEIIFSSGFQTRYDLYLEIYFEETKEIKYEEASNLLNSLYSCAIPLCLEDPRFNFVILLPQLVKCESILHRCSNIEMIFNNELFNFNSFTITQFKNINVPVEDLTKIENTNDFLIYFSKKTTSPTNFDLKSFKEICMGGTYDYIHLGHKLLLSCAALVASKSVLVGISSDQLLAKKSHKSVLESFPKRLENVQKFLTAFDPNIEQRLVKIEDSAGPAKSEPFDAIVATEETYKGVEFVNKSRISNGLNELAIVLAGLVKGTDDETEKLSSTTIRKFFLTKVKDDPQNFEFLHQEWKNLMLESVVDDQDFIDLWFDRIKEKYSEAWRFYHTLNHIRELLNTTNENKDKIHNISLIKLTVWFHDIIYIPPAKSGKNEADSAEYFEEFFNELEKKYSGKHKLTRDLVDQVKKIILFTANHTKPSKEVDEWPDAQFFLDIDLAILGADPERYDEYSESILKEYCFMDHNVLRPKRAEFMAKFLNKEINMYRTEHFRKLFEENAMKNIKNEIDKLTQS